MKRNHSEEEHSQDNHPTKKLGIDDGGGEGAARPSVVASHYNARPQVNVEKRQESIILQMKNFNNWIKSLLIGRYTRRGDRVLDFCCGKGGDLLKWIKADVGDLVGVDIADISISHAKERYSEKRTRFRANFFAMDCFKEDLSSRIDAGTVFDIVSCQFALHYCALDEASTRKALENVTKFLRPGGHFIGTIPDANRIMKRLRESEYGSFGNSIYSIVFDSKEHDSVFGHKYVFELADAIDSCPEYLLHFPTLVRIAAEYGLRPVFRKGFHEMFVDEIKDPKNLSLLYRMSVVNEIGTISPHEWEAIGIYMAFAFEKVS
ncbi:mRNA cap guanine-N7 methyltransferase [Phlyctochytrium planicorne]|nr:mRNA cap guanine-N7 methyltransferase [Phlyctochytrium planicorne]